MAKRNQYNRRVLPSVESIPNLKGFAYNETTGLTTVTAKYFEDGVEQDSATWTFNSDGDLTYPDNSVSYTANVDYGYYQSEGGADGDETSLLEYCINSSEHTIVELNNRYNPPPGSGGYDLDSYYSLPNPTDVYPGFTIKFVTSGLAENVSGIFISIANGLYIDGDDAVVVEPYLLRPFNGTGFRARAVVTAIWTGNRWVFDNGEPLTGP